MKCRNEVLYQYRQHINTMTLFFSLSLQSWGCFLDGVCHREDAETLTLWAQPADRVMRKTDWGKWNFSLVKCLLVVRLGAKRRRNVVEQDWKTSTSFHSSEWNWDFHKIVRFYSACSIFKRLFFCPHHKHNGGSEWDVLKTITTTNQMGLMNLWKVIPLLSWHQTIKLITNTYSGSLRCTRRAVNSLSFSRLSA